ncbi:MAG: hypothetical protein KKE20_06605 [Nanoarchaeota archaeon]|nr:hypothetical protein [Nanoarchaeota archaeon]
MVKKKVKPAEMHVSRKSAPIFGVSRKVGHYSFLVGVILALILGLFSEQISPSWSLKIMFVLVVLGLIVGLLNIQHKEMAEFLLAAIALMVVAPAMNVVSLTIDKFVFGSGVFLRSMLTYLIIFIVPAVLIVAVKVIVELAEEN